MVIKTTCRKGHYKWVRNMFGQFARPLPTGHLYAINGHKLLLYSGNCYFNIIFTIIIIIIIIWIVD